MAEAVGTEITMPKQGEFCWAEIATNDLEAVKNFYTKIFGWEYQKTPSAGEGMEYFTCNLPGEYGQAGMYKMDPAMFGGNAPPPHFMNYIAVDDVDAMAAKAVELGGKIHVPPMDIPNTGRFSMIEDPTGAHVALITLIPMAQGGK
jgi:predicted enzyme related to lactoylglutathione lyase